MRRNRQRGSSYVEFAFCAVFLVPLLLGATGIGMNLLLAYQASQLSRDAGHMYARQVNFALSGNQTILATVGSGVGLSATSGVSGSSGSGKALTVFTTVSYVDDNACVLGGYTTNGTTHNSSCKNFGQWVFRQRIIVGNSDLMATNYGSPVTSGNGHGNPLVTIDSSGNVSTSDQLTNPNDVATFNAINPYSSAGSGSGLPSGQVIYIAEVAASGFVMPPFQKNPIQYAYNMF